MIRTDDFLIGKQHDATLKKKSRLIKSKLSDGANGVSKDRLPKLKLCNVTEFKNNFSIALTPGLSLRKRFNLNHH